MGRRNQVEAGGQSIPNPAKKRLEFQGTKGYFQYYDKEIQGDDKNVRVGKVRFLLLTEMTMLTGFNSTNKGLWSNEISDQKTETLELMCKGADGKPKSMNIKGLYADIKDKVSSKSIGGKYTKSLYVTFRNSKEKTWELQKIQLSGKQLTSWIDVMESVIKAGVSKYNVMFEVDEIKYVTGSINYYYPTFKYTVLSEENVDQRALMITADKMYDIVEDFIEKRKAGVTADTPSARENQSKAAPVDNSFVVEEDEENDDLPF